MPLLPMIYLGAPGGALRAENNRIVKSFEPFWATPDFVHRYKRARYRLLTLDEYGARLWAMTDERLRQQAKSQGLSDAGTREELLQRLIAPLAELKMPEEPFSFYTLTELRLEALARGITHTASREELLQALKVRTPIHPGDPIEGYREPGATVADEGLDLEGDLEDEPDIEGAPTSTTMTTEQRAALLQALDADDYGAIYAATKAISGQSPPKAKSELIAAAQSLLK